MDFWKPVFFTISVAGTVGLTILTTVDNPTSAPMKILGDIGLDAGLRIEGNLSRFASLKRCLGNDELKKISFVFHNEDAESQN
jgi:hypothetical protein